MNAGQCELFLKAYGPTYRAMKKLLALAAVTVGLAVASVPANAQSYVVNGHSASKAKVQLLVSHGAQPGKWLYGISAADSRPTTSQPTAGNGGASAGMSSMCCCASRAAWHNHRARRSDDHRGLWPPKNPLADQRLIIGLKNACLDLRRGTSVTTVTSLTRQLH